METRSNINGIQVEFCGDTHKTNIMLLCDRIVASGMNNLSLVDTDRLIREIMIHPVVTPSMILVAIKILKTYGSYQLGKGILK